jgi:5-methylcytosine-specific restriction enzyme subunit McrC
MVGVVQTIRLTEYERREVELPAEVAADLARVAGTRLVVAVGPTPGTHVVAATSHVGSIVTDDVTVVVSPKVAPDLLFYMLGVSPPPFTGASVRGGAAAGLLEIMAAVFASVVDAATVRGVLHGYRHTEDRLDSPRGRIDVTEQIRRPAILIPIACRYDEYTTDILVNRTLIAALDRLRRVPGLSPALRARLNRVAARFEDVAHVPVDLREVDRWKPGRLDRHYSSAMRLAAVVLRNLTISQRAGSVRSPSFTIDMNTLFQDFVVDRLRTCLRGRLEVADEPPVPLAESGRPVMNPDLMFRRNGQDVYVGDVKYKLSTGPARTTDYYQLLAYAVATGLGEGVLVYAQDPGDEQDPLHGQLVNTAVVRNSRHLLHVYRLPLTGGITGVEDAMARLADWIVDRAIGVAPEAAA